MIFIIALIIVSVVSVTPLSATVAVVLAVAIPQLVPGDVHNNSLYPRFSALSSPDGSEGGHMSVPVIKAIAIVFIISILFVLALFWLTRWRRNVSQFREPPAPVRRYNHRVLRAYHENASSGRPGPEASEWHSPAGIQSPAQAHIRSPHGIGRGSPSSQSL